MRTNNNVAFVCKYPVVWCPKYRRKVLIDGVETNYAQIQGGRAGRDADRSPAPDTSRTCSCCGVIDIGSRKDQATFECLACGHEDNADVNAAKNILQARTVAVEPPKRTLRRVGKRKQPVGAIHAGV